jgi:hypothetical protein
MIATRPHCIRPRHFLWGCAMSLLTIALAASSVRAGGSSTRPAATRHARPTDVDAFHLPANGELRVAVPTLGFDEYMNIRQFPRGFMIWKGEVELRGSGDHNPKLRVVIENETDFDDYIAEGRGAFAVGGRSQTTIASLSNVIADMVRAADRCLPPETPFTVYVTSDSLRYELGMLPDKPSTFPTTRLAPVRTAVEPRRLEPSGVLATLDRWAIVFATDPAQPSVADLDLTVNDSGQMRSGEQIFYDEQIAAAFRLEPRRGQTFSVSLTITRPELTILSTLARSVARIVLSGENSLAKGQSVVLYIKSPTLLTELGQ